MSGFGFEIEALVEISGGKELRLEVEREERRGHEWHGKLVASSERWRARDREKEGKIFFRLDIKIQSVLLRRGAS